MQPINNIFCCVTFTMTKPETRRCQNMFRIHLRSLPLPLAVCVCLCVWECVFVFVLSPRATRDPVNLPLGFVAVFAWHIMSKNILTTPSQPPQPPQPLSHHSWLQLLTLLQSIGRLPPSQVPETGMECRRGAPRHITYRSVQEEAAGLHGSDYCLEVGGETIRARAGKEAETLEGRR